MLKQGYLFNLFKPKYLNRIENNIRELELQLLHLKMMKVRYSNPTEYCRFILQEDKLEHDIELLKSLL